MNQKLIKMVGLALIVSPLSLLRADASVSLHVPMESMFYGYNSRFSSHQLGTYKRVVQEILSQIGCSANLDSYRRSGEIDSNTFHLDITGLCPVSYDLRFQTLTTELVGTFKPDLLFLNGRLVKMGGVSGQISFSDGKSSILKMWERGVLVMQATPPNNPC